MTDWSRSQKVFQRNGSIVKRDSRIFSAPFGNVFLTGVTGFLGGAFLSLLLDDGLNGELVCLVRAPSEALARARVLRSIARFGHYRLPKWVRVLPGDVTDDSWHTSPALDAITHTLHLAASTSFGKEESVHLTNVTGALSVARSMRGRNLERYLHTGTATICGAHPPNVVHESDYPHPDAEHLVAYTRTKAEAESELLKRYGDLPIVTARPSIVVGHTKAGVAPSGSIFWVLRVVEALGFLAWSPNNRIDVVPVDWVAAALKHLLFAEDLYYDRYHLSAGDTSSVRWSDIEAEAARIRPSHNRYQIGTLSDLTHERIRAAIPDCHPRHLMMALELYSRFCSLDLIFDNHRLLREGVPPPPRFTDYMRVCLESSPASIYEQMRTDFESTPIGVPA